MPNKNQVNVAYQWPLLLIWVANVYFNSNPKNLINMPSVKKSNFFILSNFGVSGIGWEYVKKNIVFSSKPENFSCSFKIYFQKISHLVGTLKIYFDCITSPIDSASSENITFMWQNDVILLCFIPMHWCF